MKNATEELKEIIAELEQIAADMNADNQALDRLLEEKEKESRPDYKWEDYEKHRAEEDARIKREYED